MKLTLSRSLAALLFSLPLALPLIGCAADTEGDDGDEEVGVTDDALKQGGCSNAQIRSAQAECRSDCKAKGQVSRGLKFCYVIPGGDDPDFKAQRAYACACAKK